MREYEFINHTADLGIKVRGETLAELFVNSAFAMFDIMMEDIRKVKSAKKVRIKIPGGEKEDLLFDWLRELLSRFNIDKLVFSRFDILKLTDEGLEAAVKGEKLDFSRHELKTELKAVTYHGLEVNKTKNNWEAQVIFDI